MYNDIQLKDRIIICCDCGEEFIFDEGEQRFFIKNKLAPPKRCSTCRFLKKMDNAPEVAH